MTQPVCHDPANALLPWHLNGTLEGDEAAAVRAHLETCAVCTSELVDLAEIAAGARAGMSRFGLRRWWPAAAALLLPIALGVVWSASRFGARSPGVEPAPLQPIARLDLGAGPVRGAGAVPRLVLPASTERVALSLVLPVVPEGPTRIQLESTSGKVLADSPAGGGCAVGTGCTYSVGASLVSEPGRYAVVIVDGDRRYRFPFAVESPR